MTSTIDQDGRKGRLTSPALDKAAMVLQAIADARTPLTFSELSSRVSLARSSLHDICSGLLRNGFVDKTDDDRYQIGMRIVELSRHRVVSMNIVQAFQQTISQHSNIQETVVLAVPSSTNVTYVAFVDSGRPLAVRYEIGMRLPAAFTASGKAILATYDTSEVLASYDSSIVNPTLNRPGKTRDVLLEELVIARNNGYSVDDEETAVGMICFGMPVFSAVGDGAIGAIAISLVKSQWAAMPPRYTEYLAGVARDITVQLRGDTRWYDLNFPELIRR